MKEHPKNVQRGELGTWAEGERQVQCDKDGRSTWHGAMICAECGWLFRVEKVGDEFDGPEQCGNCGAVLVDMPERDVRGTARICCEDCFERCGGEGAVVVQA